MRVASILTFEGNNNDNKIISPCKKKKPKRSVTREYRIFFLSMEKNTLPDDEYEKFVEFIHSIGTEEQPFYPGQKIYLILLPFCIVVACN
jgi:hypothetical protein